MLPYKTIVVTGISELPPYEIEKGDTQLEMLNTYIKRQNFKTVVGSERVSIAYLIPNLLEPNLSFKFDESGSLIEVPIQSSLIVQNLPYWHREQHEIVS